MSRFLPMLLLSCFLFVGCLTQHREPLPIDEDQLEAVLLDVHVAEAAMGQLQGGEKKDSLANLYYDQIAAIHKIDREVLDTCLSILQRNPEQTKEIYEKMAEKMEELKENK